MGRINFEAKMASSWHLQPEGWKFRRTWYVRAIAKIAQRHYFDPSKLTDAECKRIRKYWNRVNEYRSGEGYAAYSLASLECLKYYPDMFLPGTKPYFNLSRASVWEAFQRRKHTPYKLLCGWLMQDGRSFLHSWTTKYETAERRDQAKCDIEKHYANFIEGKRFECQIVS